MFIFKSRLDAGGNSRLTVKGTSFSNAVRNAVIFTELIDGQWKGTNFDEHAES